MKKNVQLKMDNDLYYKGVGLFEKLQVTSMQKLLVKLLQDRLIVENIMKESAK